MAAPDFVPTDPTQRVRGYTSPPRREGSWVADRPGDLAAGQPSGVRLGSPGPDQGYVLTLVRFFDGKLHLGEVEHADAVAGCVAVAMKRAALFGRAPVIHDLKVAFTVFGFLDQYAAAELVSLREAAFAEIHSHHHYRELRAVADLVADEALRQPHDAISADYASSWKRSLRL